MHTDAKQTTEIPFWPTGVRVEKTRVVMFNSSTIWSSHSFISVWDLSSNQVHEIGSLRRVWLWHMEVDRNELVTFTEYFDDLSRTLTPYISYHWNCRRNRLDICNAATGTTTMHPYQLDRREVYTHKVARSYSRRPKHPPGSPALFALYVVSCFNRHEHLVSHDGIQIWYFDPKLEPPRAFAWRGFRANNGGRSLNLRDDLMIQDHLTVN